MGVISPNISETLKLDQVNEALEHFSTDKSSGKIILKITEWLIRLIDFMYKIMFILKLLKQLLKCI